jgi:hypothetical protein
MSMIERMLWWAHCVELQIRNALNKIRGMKNIVEAIKVRLRRKEIRTIS